MGALVLAGLVALPSAASAAATIDERLGAGLPLVLKDGRIANVTVHTIPFATGADAPDAATMAALEATFRPLATDCFLTAQAIGHVAPGITRDGDTLAAHRLARARADGIQATLAGFGMPQPAVASVWDWQFLVQESQVTLWVFSLTVGDDCEGTPLPIEAPALAAVNDAPTEAPAAIASPALPAARTTTEAESSVDATEGAADPAEASRETAPRELRVAEDAPELPAVEPARQVAQPDDLAANGTLLGVAASSVADTADSAPRSEISSASSSVATSAAQRSLEPTEQSAARPLDPLATAATSQTARSAAGVDAIETPAPDAPATLVAAVDVEATPPAGDSAAPAVVITFDVNSSYFPAGAGPRLRAFLESLPEAQPVQLELAAAVGAGAVRGASGEEAERYNAWMAERRVQRVAEWLEANARDRPITVTERLVENDTSREVRVFTTISP